jgi:hypothetical protein
LSKLKLPDRLIVEKRDDDYIVYNPDDNHIGCLQHSAIKELAEAYALGVMNTFDAYKNTVPDQNDIIGRAYLHGVIEAYRCLSKHNNSVFNNNSMIT